MKLVRPLRLLGAVVLAATMWLTVGGAQAQTVPCPDGVPVTIPGCEATPPSSTTTTTSPTTTTSSPSSGSGPVTGGSGSSVVRTPPTSVAPALSVSSPSADVAGVTPAAPVTPDVAVDTAAPTAAIDQTAPTPDVAEQATAAARSTGDRRHHRRNGNVALLVGSLMVILGFIALSNPGTVELRHPAAERRWAAR